MRAGDLRHRLAIQEARETTDPKTGQAVKAWVTINTVWGNLDALRGQKLFQAQQISPRVTHEITLRGGSGLLTNHRIVFRERALNVTYVADARERGIMTTAYATEVPGKVPA